MTSPDLAAPVPRLAPFAGFRPAFAWGLRRAFGGKRFLVTAAIALAAGAGLGAILAKQRDPVLALWEFLDDGLLAVAVPLVALALVGTGFGDEVQDQTLVFHLVRPISRRTLFVARYASGLVAGVAVSAAMTVAAVAAAGIGVPGSVYATVAAVTALGTAAVGALYYALAAVFRRGLVAGLVYTFLVEGLFQKLPGSIQRLSLMHHVRSVFHRATDAEFAARSAEVAQRVEPAPPRLDITDPQGMVASAVREEWTTVPSALWICAFVIAAALVVGGRAIARKDFALKD